MSGKLWETFAQDGVQLATSYYSDDTAEHEAITKGRSSHVRTKANITEALRRSIPLRVGLVDVQDGPNCGPACNPSCWPHGTGPCGPKGGCVPNYGRCGPDDDGEDD